MSIEAMKQALEALDLALSDEPYFVKAGIAMVALRQAIEKAEKNDFYPDWHTSKPLLDRITELEKQDIKCAGCNRQASYGYALYCAGCLHPKREWVGLTDEQITTLLRRVTIEASLDMLYVTESGMNVFAKQLEQQLKELNK